MSKGKSRSPSSKAYYTKYKSLGLRLVHKKAKIAKHLKKHPNDLQSARSL